MEEVPPHIVPVLLADYGQGFPLMKLIQFDSKKKTFKECAIIYIYIYISGTKERENVLIILNWLWFCKIIWWSRIYRCKVFVAVTLTSSLSSALYVSMDALFLLCLAHILDSRLDAEIKFNRMFYHIKFGWCSTI